MLNVRLLVGWSSGEGVGFFGEVGGGHVLQGFEEVVHGEGGVEKCGVEV
jgi:hypothetical protein